MSLFPFRPRPHDCEWIGGRYTLPKPVREGNELFYPEVDIWLELPRGVLVGSSIGDPRKAMPFAEGLREAMKHPAEGSPRRPARIRVPDERLADALRDAVDSDISVIVAPVPELDAAFADLTSAMAASEPYATYLAGGAIAPAVVARLFSAASILFRTAPWRRVSEDQLLRVDIPRLQVEGACLSIIGGAGESFGLLLFRSLDAFERFAAAPPAPASGEELLAPRPKRETAMLSLSFDRKKDLPRPMQQEIAEHRWEIAGPRAYPVALAVDADAMPQPMTERELRILTACAMAFAAFFARHGSLFEDEYLDEPVCESFTGDDEVTVTLTAPYGANEQFDVNDVALDAPPVRVPAVGRNDPCPCGSGKKYKKCHLDADRASLSIPPEHATVHEMDRSLVRAIGQFAFGRFGRQWFGRAGKDFEVDEPSAQLFIPWITWTAVAKEKPVAEWYRQENESRLSTEERDWFAAQRSAWLSIWEIVAVKPGTIDVRDLLTGERRSVQETLGSRTIVARDTVLARVVDFRGRSLFGGTHGWLLPPTDGAEVVRVVRSKLRVRKGDVAIERLQDPGIGRFMIDRWEDAVAERDERAFIPPVLQNTDGDPLRFVTESFAFDMERRAEIEKRLAAMDDLDGVQRGKTEITFVFARPADRTVVGRVILDRHSLRIETNSERRADALRRRVRDACGAMLGDGSRESADPPSLHPGSQRAIKPPPPMSPREQALIREVKEAHYRDWIDTPIPALGGRTPRAAARSAKSREKLDLLLREIENRENRLPEKARFDVGPIRRELGLEE